MSPRIKGVVSIHKRSYHTITKNSVAAGDFNGEVAHHFVITGETVEDDKHVVGHVISKNFEAVNDKDFVKSSRELKKLTNKN
jgi:hypothetical protein